MTQSKLPSPKDQPEIFSYWNFLIAPHPKITGLAEQRLARLSAVLAISLVLFNLIGGVTTSQRSVENAFQVFGIPAIISLIAYFIIRTRFFTLGSFVLVSGFCLSGYLNIIENNLEIKLGVLFYIPIALTIASALISSWALFLLTGLNIGVIFLLPYIGVTLPENIGGVLGLVTSFSLVLIYINNFRKNIEQQQLSELKRANVEAANIRANLQNLVDQSTITLDRRAARLESAALVARVAAETRDLKELLDTTTQLISKQFSYYHVGVFLADENSQYLKLASASSAIGEKLVSSGHSLKIGREGIVGFAAHQKRSRIAQDVGKDTAFYNNPDLPATKSEAALPLIARNILVGVLDIQSEEETAFTSDDISILQTMADQIALAIENIRLIEQSQLALHSLESVQVENITKAWRKRLENQVTGYVYTPYGVKSIDREEFFTRNDDTENGQHLQIPIVLRGKNIGYIKLLRKSKESNWTDTEKEMVNQITQQIGLAIDNARLIEESQRRIAREKTVNDLSVRFNSSLDLETLLQNSVKEIYKIPQVSEVSLLINPIKEAQEKEKSKNQ